MERTLKLCTVLLVGLSLEALIWVLALAHGGNNAEVFKLAARYSGRLSLAVYLFAFHLFATAVARGSSPGINAAQRVVLVFAVLHLIHLGFVAMNVHLNGIELVPFKLAGGALAYAMVVVYPFVMLRFRTVLTAHLVYFLYVGAVMAITLLARVQGAFEGAEPGPLQFVSLGVLLVAMLLYTALLLRGNKKG